MYLLVRDVSQYTEWAPILLGVFTYEAAASAARLAYIAGLAGNDPWQQQAYKTSNPETDTRVMEIEGHCSSNGSPNVYLVTRHLEGMGQFSRWYLAVFSSLDEALARAAQEDAEEKVIAEYISVEEFAVNDTRYFDHARLPFQLWGSGLWTPPEG